MKNCGGYLDEKLSDSATAKRAGERPPKGLSQDCTAAVEAILEEVGRMIRKYHPNTGPVEEESGCG